MARRKDLKVGDVYVVQGRRVMVVATEPYRRVGSRFAYPARYAPTDKGGDVAVAVQTHWTHDDGSHEWEPGLRTLAQLQETEAAYDRRVARQRELAAAAAAEGLRTKARIDAEIDGLVALGFDRAEVMVLRDGYQYIAGRDRRVMVDAEAVRRQMARLAVEEADGDLGQAVRDVCPFGLDHVADVRIVAEARPMARGDFDHGGVDDGVGGITSDADPGL